MYFKNNHTKMPGDNLNRVKGFFNDKGRECPGCGKFKEWKFFNNNKNGFQGKTTKCKECLNGCFPRTTITTDEKKYIIDESVSKEKYGKYRKHFDFIYDNDEIIQHNKKIKSKIPFRKIDEYQDLLDKICFLIFKKGYNIKHICLIYNIQPYIIKNISYKI